MIEQLIDLVTSSAFLWGAVVGASFLGWLGVFSLLSYKKTLLYCAQGKTTEKLLDGKFYYLVEESEHNRSFRDLMALEALREVEADLCQGLESMRARKDGAYLERNRVVAALASVFPSGLATTAIEGWSPEWHGCVYIDLPTGQVSWHFHDSQAYLFEGLPPYTKPWDGHDTEEKYRRVAALVQLHPLYLTTVPAVEYDVAGAPKLQSTVLEVQAVQTLNSIKAWADSGERNPMPGELQAQVDAVLSFAGMRRMGVQA